MEYTATYRMLVLLSILLQLISANAQMYGGAWPGAAPLSPYMAPLSTPSYNQWGGASKYATPYQGATWAPRSLGYNSAAYKTWNPQPEQATTWSNTYSWGQIPEAAYGPPSGRYAGNPYAQWIDPLASSAADPAPDDPHASYKDESNIMQSWPYSTPATHTPDRGTPDALANIYRNAFKEVMRAYMQPPADSPDDAPSQPHAHPAAAMQQHPMKFPAYPGASSPKKEPTPALLRRSAAGSASSGAMAATPSTAAVANAAAGASAADGARK